MVKNKHLSANQSLGYKVQPVKFKNLYRKYMDKWISTYDYLEKKFGMSNWRDYIKQKALTGENQMWGGKGMIILQKSISKYGMQFPIPVRLNRYKKRLEYVDFGFRRIKYAILNDYISIDAVVTEDINVIKDIDFKTSGEGRKIYFSEIPFNSNDRISLIT